VNHGARAAAQARGPGEASCTVSFKSVCVVENPAGMFWDYGENASFPSQTGWVGVKYMPFEGSGISF
jgi:hypothetical protein